MALAFLVVVPGNTRVDAATSQVFVGMRVPYALLNKLVGFENTISTNTRYVERELSLATYRYACTKEFRTEEAAIKAEATI